MSDKKKTSPTMQRNEDGTLTYTPAVMKELLTRLVQKTGGFKPDGSNEYLVHPEDEHSSPKHTFIPDAEMVARAVEKDGITDPYLSGLVEGEETTKVDPRQYTVFQHDKSEISDPNILANGLRHYGGIDGNPRMTNLVMFKPERMALHWTAILTSFLVKTETPMPTDKDADTRHFSQWVDARDENYVHQVNEIYFKLFGHDRTITHEFANEKPWDGAAERIEEIVRIGEREKKLVFQAVQEYINSPGRPHPNLTESERKHIDSAILHTTLKNRELAETTARQLAMPWIAHEIYRDRCNRAISHKMEEWYRDLVFADGYFHKKEFVPAEEAESFVLSGGSATGKSVPMALLAKKLAPHTDPEIGSAVGYDDTSNIDWKKNGLDLNNAVHMKSEVMRSLLIEPELLNYGNRLFFDESAHVERAMIRKEMFRYMDDLLKGNAGLVAMGRKNGQNLTAPIILHDRRSTYEHETETMLTGDRRLNYYYFNVPVADALSRNRLRGAIDLLDFMEAEKMNGPNSLPEGYDMTTYAPRFVNARNNIGSHESSGRRMMEMLERHAGENIIMPLYSTKVERSERPFIFGYADLKNREIHIRRIPRLIDTIDNTNFIISSENNQHIGPLPVKNLDELTKVGRKGVPGQLLNSKERERENAEYAATWLAQLANKYGYHIYISTPPVERRTNRPNEQFAEIHPAPNNAIDSKPHLTITNNEIFTGLSAKRKTAQNDADGKQKGDDDISSRYAAFLRVLKNTTLDVTTDHLQVTKNGHAGREKSLLFNSPVEYIKARRMAPDDGGKTP